MSMHTDLLIKQLNDSGILLSIDYEPGGTFSASMLTESSPQKWECRWIEGRITDLDAALERGMRQVGLEPHRDA